MKIAFISRWFADEHKRSEERGGSEQHRLQAYRELGHEVVVLSQLADSQELEVRNFNGIPVITSPRWKRLPAFWLLDKVAKLFTGHRKLFTDAWYLHQFLKIYGPFDVLEAQCEDPDGLAVAFFSLFQKLPPWCIQIFSLRYQFIKEKPVFSHQALFKFIFRRAHHVKANSFLVAECLKREYDCSSQKISVVPHNLTNQFLQNDFSISDPKNSRVLCLGALNEKKGIHYFIEAVKLLAAENPEIQFISIGGKTKKDNYSHSLLQLCSKYGLQSKISWLGEQHGQALQTEIASARVVVIPSLFDEWNRAAVEAVALGKPVIVTNQCGVAPWIERFHCGLVIAPADSTALAQAIKKALTDPSLTTRAHEAALEFRKEFSAKIIATKSLEVFNQIQHLN